jgi:uncharacterized UPF0160 family protein
MSTAPPAKRAKLGGTFLQELTARIFATDVVSKASETDGREYIATHHGSFHCDEALACAMLKCLPAYQSLPIVRTRTPEDIDGAAIVVDVGGTYEPEKQRFDHHQGSFSDVYSEKHGIRLSSAGLVYKHYGKDVVSAIASSLAPGALSEADVTELVEKVYNDLIKEVDAIDNGVEVTEGEMKYRIRSGLSSRVGRLNPGWNETAGPAVENNNFKAAMEMTATELIEVVAGLVTSWFPARSLVSAALAGATDVHASGQIVKLDTFCPWKGHLHDLEKAGEEGKPKALYVLYQDSRGGWRVQCVPESPNSFVSRKPLPKAWRGVRDEELSELSGIPGCVFVHAGGFIGGNATFDGALAMAVAGVEAEE